MSEFNPSAQSTDNYEREAVPPGMHAVRCARVIEIGIQKSPIYGDKDKVVVSFSIPAITVKVNGEDKQKFISAPFGITKSTHEKSDMRMYTKALAPDATNLGAFLGQACQINVIHQQKGERTIEKIDSVAPMLPGLEIPELDTQSFWFEWEKPNEEYWAMIPAFTKKLMAEADNYEGSYVEELALSVGTDDTPY